MDFTGHQPIPGFGLPVQLVSLPRWDYSSRNELWDCVNVSSWQLPTQHLDIHHGRLEQAHFSTNRPEKGDTGSWAICEFLPLEETWVLLRKVWQPDHHFVHFTKEIFGKDLRNFQIILRLAQCYSHPLWAPLDQTQAFNEGNGKFGDLGKFDLSAQPWKFQPQSLSADRSWFLHIQVYHQNTCEHFKTQKQIAEKHLSIWKARYGHSTKIMTSETRLCPKQHIL